MYTYHVKVYCRKVGAIGIFEYRYFTLISAKELNRDEVVDLWFASHGDNYELNHLEVENVVHN